MSRVLEVFNNRGDIPEDLKEISNYLQNRLHRYNLPDEQYVERSRDYFGNTVFNSGMSSEPTTYNEEQSVIIVSPEGRKVIYSTKGILKDISRGELDEYDPKFIGGNAEGKVFKIMVADKPYALKFYFPVYRAPEDDILYTPGIDQMRWMQLARESDPVEGLNYTVPILATLDMTLAPYVENSATFYQVYYRISDLFASPDDALTKDFIDRYRRNMRLVNQGLVQWYDKIISNEFPFDIYSTSFSRDEVEDNLDNFMVCLDRVNSFYQDYKTHPKKYDDEFGFLIGVRDTMTMIEFTAGGRKAKEVNYRILRKERVN